jgi:lipopolysaccharide/colanic/teichoic acid biosynthesis glycosyltransferase
MAGCSCFSGPLASRFLHSVSSDAKDELYFREVHLSAHSLLARSYEDAAVEHSALFIVVRHLSPWACSESKRIFDCFGVLLSLPLLLPLLLLIALAVRLTSAGPAFFLQKRVGRHGRLFTILKFRTMPLAAERAHHPVTTSGNQRFTLIGPFLRRWKLDELPQLLNVLWGDMSLVGPRPKLPEHVIADLPCRPGITGAATIAFAREEVMLDRVPRHHLNSYYHTIVLPAKRRLDAEYMARSTFRSDFKLILNSALRRWDNSILEGLLREAEFEADDRVFTPRTLETIETHIPARKLPQIERPVSVEGTAIL